MKRLLVLVLVGLWSWPGSGALAQERPPEGGSPPALEKTPPTPEPAVVPCPLPCVPLVEKTISSHKLYLQEHQAATTIPRMATREVEVCKEKQPSLKLDWHEEKFTCTEITFEKREIDQEVTCITVQPETTVDPCTGQSCTIYKQVPVVKKVTITVFEPKPKEKEYIVRYPYVKSIEKDVLVQQLTVDSTTIPAIEKTLTVIPAPCEAKVVVPVFPPPCLPK